MPSIYQSTCQGTCDVSGAGSPAYDNAYFEINYVRAYTTGTVTSTASPTGPTSTATVLTTSTASAPTRTGGSQTDTSGARVPSVTPAGGAGATLVVLACAFFALLLL